MIMLGTHDGKQEPRRKSRHNTLTRKRAGKNLTMLSSCTWPDSTDDDVSVTAICFVVESLCHQIMDQLPPVFLMWSMTQLYHVELYTVACRSGNAFSCINGQASVFQIKYSD